MDQRENLRDDAPEPAAGAIHQSESEAAETRLDEDLPPAATESPENIRSQRLEREDDSEDERLVSRELEPDVPPVLEEERREGDEEEPFHTADEPVADYDKPRTARGDYREQRENWPERRPEPSPSREPQRGYERGPRRPDPNPVQRSREPQKPFRPAEPAAIKEAIDEVNRVMDVLRDTLDDMEELLETLELAERQKDADEQEIESLKKALRSLHRPREGAGRR